MAKQYKTWELIKAWQEGVRGEFQSTPNSVQKVQLEDIGIILEDGNSYYLSPVDTKILWTKVQEPVTMLEAFNSKKQVKHESSKLRGLSRHQGINAVLYDLALLHPDTARDLINGKWLIEED